MPIAEPVSQAPNETAAEPASELSFLELLIILARRKALIAATAFIFALAALVLSFVLPSMYTATTVVLPPQTASAGAALMSQLTSISPMAAMAGSSLGIKDPNDMYVAMFKSRTVEDAMVQRFGLRNEYRVHTATDARTAFEKRATIVAAKDGLIHISVASRDPRHSADLANAYVEEYRKLSGTLAISEAAQRRFFFEQQLAQARGNLGNAEEALKTTEQKTGMLQLDSQARSLIESAASLRAQIAAKQVEIRGMGSYAAPDNPDLVMARQQLAGWQGQLARLTGSEGSSDDLLLSKGQVPQASLEYARKWRDVKYYDTIFELLARQFEMAKLDEARQGSLVQVMDAAVPPDHRSSPRTLLMVLFGAAAGLLIGLFSAFALEALAMVRRKPQERARLDLLQRLLFAREPDRAPTPA